MHLDLNSCFATIEQQANPRLRGKPIAVAAYNSPSGCILAPSVEAKKLGIKTGFKVREAKMLCPNLIVLLPDPNKYRNIHLKFRAVLEAYSDKVTPKSIDEFILDLTTSPALKKGVKEVSLEIKQRIKEEIGEWLTISVGIAPNRFLAKTAAGLHKPDGLDVIDKSNYLEIFKSLKLVDLCGIKAKNAARLNNMGIYTVLDFFNSPIWKLKAAFKSITGYYWWCRLHGWEIDETLSKRGSFGNSFALPKPLVTPEELAPILQKLVEKMGFRMRQAGFRARGVHLSILYRDFDYWHQGISSPNFLFDSRDIYRIIFNLLLKCPNQKSVRELAVSCFNLQKDTFTQMSLFEDLKVKNNLVKAMDNINERWGDFIITPATMMETQDLMPDRISFGGVKGLEEIIRSEMVK
ncbi:MAG: DNA polymerase IV [Candidatus Daviesbacteria bacterium]|nr:DNA polymerase IV [Candidatus Daviesbacteria bacterium]